MNNVILAILLAFVSFNLEAQFFPKKYNLEFIVEDFDKIKNQICVVVIGYENFPHEESAEKDSILLAINDNTWNRKYPDRFRSIQVTAYVIGSDNKPIDSTKSTYNLGGFSKFPDKNPINLSFYKDISDQTANAKSIEQFKNLLLNFSHDEKTEPLVNDKKINNDIKFPLGTLLFIDEIANKTLRYNLYPNGVENKKSVSLEDEKLNQKEIIDVSNLTSGEGEIKFPGIFLALNLSLENALFLEYTLNVDGYKENSIINFEDEVFRRLRSNQPDEFFQNIFETLIKVEPNNYSQYKLQLVSSVYVIDEIILSNKSYKYISKEGKMDLEGRVIGKVKGGAKVTYTDTLVTVVEKRNLYIDYKITDFSTALYIQLQKYVDGRKKEDFEKYAKFYKEIAEKKQEEFNTMFKAYASFVGLESKYISEQYVVNSNTFRFHKLPEQVEERIDIINGYYNLLKGCITSADEAMELHRVFDVKSRGIELSDSEISKLVRTNRIDSEIFSSKFIDDTINKK